MNDVLPSRPTAPEEVALPSGGAILAGVFVGFGAFTLLISVVAAFANGAHSHQVLSAATWKQLGTGGGIVTGIVLFVAWGAGGFVAARLAGRDGVRHGVWVFIAGVVLITIVGAAITWLPDTTAILRNLRLVGLPLRRNEWRDFGTVAGVSSILGMAVGSVTGGWWALRTIAPAVVPERVPVAAPPAFAPEPEEEVEEPVFMGPSLFEPAFQPELEPQAAPEPVLEPLAEPEPAAQDAPAWLQFIEERERAIRERDSGYSVEASEPVPTFIEEPEPEPPEPMPEPEPVLEPVSEPLSEPVEATSWWPGQPEPAPETERSPETQPSFDDAWALPDEDAPAVGEQTVEDAAFPHPPPTPVGEPEAEDVEAFVAPPPAEHAEWTDDERTGYQAPPEPGDEHALLDAPEAPLPEVDDEEREARRRQQEEAARAYEQMRDEQS